MGATFKGGAKQKGAWFGCLPFDGTEVLFGSDANGVPQISQIAGPVLDLKENCLKLMATHLN